MLHFEGRIMQVTWQTLCHPERPQPIAGAAPFVPNLLRTIAVPTIYQEKAALLIGGIHTLDQTWLGNRWLSEAGKKVRKYTMLISQHFDYK